MANSDPVVCIATCISSFKPAADLVCVIVDCTLYKPHVILHVNYYIHKQLNPVSFLHHIKEPRYEHRNPSIEDSPVLSTLTNVPNCNINSPLR